MNFIDWLVRHLDDYPLLAGMELPDRGYWPTVWASGQQCEFDWDTLDMFVDAWDTWETSFEMG